jgi:integrase
MAKRKAKDKFPLGLHAATKQWCKKHKGKPYYFGTDKDAALKRYVEEWSNIVAGRPRFGEDSGRSRRSTDLTLADLASAFLVEKKRAVDAGEIAGRTWSDYYATCKSVVEALGKERLVTDLGPNDFAKLRDSVARRLGPVSVLNLVTRARVLFKFAYDFDLIPSPVKYGAGFKRPTPETLRKERNKRSAKLIPAAGLCKMIDAADVQVRAMIYLALNGGLGATDCSELTSAALDERPGWLNYPRPKTGVERRFPLWPETVAALKAVRTARPAAKIPQDDDRVFLTRLGQPWVRFDGDDQGKRSSMDAVTKQFGKLADNCGVKVRGFYSLRHVHRTVSDETLDRPAIDLVMGHADGSMAGRYRERISDERLEAVVNHVRAWLLAGRPKGNTAELLPFKPAAAG